MASSVTNHRPAPTHWSYRPRFSLRWLLLAVTAFAIGFPIWYRWPYIEEDRELAAEYKYWLKDVPRRTITWQRQWGGGRLLHGEERTYWGAVLIKVVTYCDGKRHGRYLEFRDDGEPDVEGQYTFGKRDGVWTQHDVRGVDWRIHWKDGIQHGLSEFLQSDGKFLKLQFHQGRVTHSNGRPIESRLLWQIARNEIETEVVRDQLAVSKTSVDYIDLPLADVATILADQHGIPLSLTPCIADPKKQVTLRLVGVDLATALAVLTQMNGLDCDYRYGRLWITTVEDAKAWSDPTGINKIVPPAGSSLARRWNELTTVPVGYPVGESLFWLKEWRIDLDLSVIEHPNAADPNVTFVTVGETLPLHQVLGSALYQTGCRCELRGETLVVFRR